MILTRAIPGHWLTSEVVPAVVCDCALRGYYTCVADPFAGFTQGPAGVWTRNVQEVLPLEFTDGVTPLAGMRVFAWAPGMAESLTANNGPYIIEEPGSSTTYAKLHRDPAFDESSEFYLGMKVAVVGGDTYSGAMFTLIEAPAILGTDPMIFALGAGGGGIGPAWLTDAALDVSRIQAGTIPLTFEADVSIPAGATAMVEFRTGGNAETAGSTVAARCTQAGPFSGTAIGASVAGLTQSAGMILLHLSASTSDAEKPIEVQKVRIFAGTNA
jgi:hypothetical protein